MQLKSLLFLLYLQTHSLTRFEISIITKAEQETARNTINQPKRGILAPEPIKIISTVQPR